MQTKEPRDFRGRGPRGEWTTYSSRTRTNGDYSSNKGRGIKDIALGSITTYWVSGGRGQNYKSRGGYRTTGCCTSWDYQGLQWSN